MQMVKLLTAAVLDRFFCADFCGEEIFLCMHGSLFDFAAVNNCFPYALENDNFE